MKDENNNKSVYGFQSNATGSKRLVRRLITYEENLQLPSENYDTCGLCLEEFKDTPSIPWTKTQCEHVFHSACLYGYFNRGNSRCPLCRTTLNITVI